MDERVRLLAIAHVSNALGTIIPLPGVIAEAKRHGIPVLVDGAQAAPHMRIDVAALDCDFYAFSGHKMFGPTGIGILFGREALLEEMPPYQGGGDMILEVRFDGTTYNDLPYKFEAGTPNIAGAIGLAAALDYVSDLGTEAIEAHEHEVLDYASAGVRDVPGLRLVGTAAKKSGILSFLMDGVHAHDVGTIVDREGVAIRTGHHCTMPLMQRFGVAATSRASFALYNTIEDADALVAALSKVREIFHR